MHYHEICHSPLARQSLLNTATLFVPRDRVEEFVAVLSLFDGRITKARILPRFGGYSVDALLDNPKAAAGLLLAWGLRSKSMTGDQAAH